MTAEHSEHDLARRVAELTAALHDAEAATRSAEEAAAAARERNVALLAALEQQPTAEELATLRAHAELAAQLQATRTWRWTHLPRSLYARVRRTHGDRHGG